MRLKHGTTNAETGKVFWSYAGKYEIWLTPEQFNNRKEKAKANAKKRYHKNIDESRRKAREWSRAHKEVKTRAYNNWADKNKAKIRDSRLRRVYGIGAEDYDRMLVEQKFKCAICKTETSAIRTNGKEHALSVDHCHKSGNVRGLLCMNCNIAIGKFDDDPALLMKAAEYVWVHNTKNLNPPLS